jgi:hypothetical protein
MLLRERPNNPNGFVGGGDAVHPGPIGHTVMAWAILKGLGAPAMVSRVSVDCKTGKADTQACQVENLKVRDNTITFERQDEALPMPIDEKAGPALKLAPILSDLSRYELQVTGLPDGNYEITVDGEPAGKASGEELTKGWNLANLPGPITRQAVRVLGLVFQKNNLYYARWRNVQLYVFPEWARSADLEARRSAELAKIDQQIAAAEAEIDSARKPVPHRFEIKPQNP